MARDPVRLFSEPQRRAVHARQRGKCAGCDTELPRDFDMHHVIPWGMDGRTHEDNALAVCRPCHRQQPVHPLPDITPREWQKRAVGLALPKLVDGRYVTVAAAPGAGKTLFTAMLIRELLARDVIDRVAVLVPNKVLLAQWATEAAKVSLRLESRFWHENPAYQGIVFNYHALLNGKLVQHLQGDDRRTLYVLDEVHHLGRDELGRHQAWAHAVGRIVGTVEDPRRPVLNLTGTPFRSKKTERIATCEYTDAGDGKSIELVTDYQVTTEELVNEGHLRHLQVHSWDAGLHIVTPTGEQDSRVLDLAANPGSVQNYAVKQLLNDMDGYVMPVLQGLTDILTMHQIALRGRHVKGLVICDNVEQARQVYGRAQAGLGLPQSALLLAVSDDGLQSHTAIEQFRVNAVPSILIAVRMVSEGFDAPDVTAIAYLSTWTAPVFIQQMVARARRVTDMERKHGRIPAEVIIPGAPHMIEAFQRILDNPDLVTAPPCPDCGRPAESCYCLTPVVDKECPLHRMPRKICPCPPGERPPSDPPGVAITVTDTAAPALLHRDGDEVDRHIMAAIRTAMEGELDLAHVPAATLGFQKALANNPYLFSKMMREPA